MCEGCGLNRPIFSLSAEGKKRWCFGCTKGHAGAQDLINKKCEGCQLKAPNLKGHAGAEDVIKRKKCEGCGL